MLYVTSAPSSVISGILFSETGAFAFTAVIILILPVVATTYPVVAVSSGVVNSKEIDNEDSFFMKLLLEILI